MIAACELVDNEENVTHIHRDATLQLGLERHITRHSLPVAVERQTDQAAVAVEYGLA